MSVARLALRGKLADIAKSGTAAHTDAAAAHTDAKAARTASEKTESSINNRSSPASDRWDAMHKDIRAIAANQKDTARDVRGLQETAHQTRRTVGQLQAEDRLGSQETEQLRTDLNEYAQQTATSLTRLRGLHDKWADQN